jgi:hypothetical protein
MYLNQCGLLYLPCFRRSNFHRQSSLASTSRERSWKPKPELCGREIADKFCRDADFHETSRDLLHAVNQRHGTHGFTVLPKEGALRICFALKNPTASAGFEPGNLGTKGQLARPPKPLNYHLLPRLRESFPQTYLK